MSVCSGSSAVWAISGILNNCRFLASNGAKPLDRWGTLSGPFLGNRELIRPIRMPGRPGVPTPTNRNDKSREPEQSFRAEGRRERCLVHRGTGRDPGLPRAKRRRQIHHHAHDHRLHPPHGGCGKGRRQRRDGKTDRGQAPDGLPAGECAALHGHDRRGLPWFLRRGAWHQRRGQGQGDRSRHRHVLPQIGSPSKRRHAFEGIPASHRFRAGDHS